MARRPMVSVLIVALATMFAVGCASDNGDESGSPSTTTSAVPFDRAFIDAMVPHHESAIEMARVSLKAGLSQTDLIAVAQDIIDTQRLEIEEMRSWRKDWFGSRKIDPQGAAELGLSEEAMGMKHDAAEIERAQDVNQAFAAAMIPHHEGAIEMAETELAEGANPEVTGLAGTIAEAQRAEVELMAGWQAAWS